MGGTLMHHGSGWRQRQRQRQRLQPSQSIVKGSAKKENLRYSQLGSSPFETKLLNGLRRLEEI